MDLSAGFTLALPLYKDYAYYHNLLVIQRVQVHFTVSESLSYVALRHSSLVNVFTKSEEVIKHEIILDNSIYISLELIDSNFSISMELIAISNN